MSKAKKEPTTAEAFATLCRLADWVSEQDADTHSFDGTAIGPPLTEAREAIALMKGRMSAMGMAIRDVLEMDAIGTPTTERDRRWAALESALTSVPPVDADALRAAEARGFERARERAARICRRMIVGGRAWTETQEVAANALGDAAAHIRAMKDETP